MSNLLVEIGNTALKGAWAQGMTLGKSFRYQGEKVFEFLEKIVDKEKPEILIVASKREVELQDENLLKSLCRTLVLIDVNHKELYNLYGLPYYLTPDRVASIIAARKLFKGKDCIIFDFGTIVSIDCLGGDGNYKGGNLSLGQRTRFKSMQRYSRDLPLVNTPKEVAPFGGSIETSIESGVLNGIFFEINGYVASNPGSIIVFTGGDADYMAKHSDSSIFVVSNLVLMGLATISNDYDK